MIPHFRDVKTCTLKISEVQVLEKNTILGARGHSAGAGEELSEDMTLMLRLPPPCLHLEVQEKMISLQAEERVSQSLGELKLVYPRV